MGRHVTYVLAESPQIEDFCVLCERAIEERGNPGVWLYRVTFPEVGRIHVDPLCATCGLEHAPVLTATLAAAWERHRARIEEADSEH